MLLPSSSSRESGARVQAGPGVSLLIELLDVILVVVVDMESWTLQPTRVASNGVWQVELVVAAVVTAVEAQVEIVVAEIADDKLICSSQITKRSVAVL